MKRGDVRREVDMGNMVLAGTALFLALPAAARRAIMAAYCRRCGERLMPVGYGRRGQRCKKCGRA